MDPETGQSTKGGKAVEANGACPALTRNISAAGAWAFAIGTSIGWGSLVVTNNTYLNQAGPLGSALGMIVGALIMLVISRNYAYMMNAFPEAGGAYAYSRDAFGYDHGLLTAWCLVLTYFAMLWANAISLPLFAQFFLGGTSSTRENCIRCSDMTFISGRRCCPSER